MFNFFRKNTPQDILNYFDKSLEQVTIPTQKKNEDFLKVLREVVRGDGLSEDGHKTTVNARLDQNSAATLLSPLMASISAHLDCFEILVTPLALIGMMKGDPVEGVFHNITQQVKVLEKIAATASQLPSTAKAAGEEVEVALSVLKGMLEKMQADKELLLQLIKLVHDYQRRNGE